MSGVLDRLDMCVAPSFVDASRQRDHLSALPFDGRSKCAASWAEVHGVNFLSHWRRHFGATPSLQVLARFNVKLVTRKSAVPVVSKGRSR